MMEAFERGTIIELSDMTGMQGHNNHGVDPTDDSDLQKTCTVCLNDTLPGQDFQSVDGACSWCPGSHDALIAGWPCAVFAMILTNCESS